MPERIVSKDNAKIKEALKAKDGKGAFFLAEGFHLVSMALSHGAAIRVFAVDPQPMEAPLFLVSEEVLRKLASTKTPEGIVALCRKKEPEPPSSPRLLYLDGISDPGNLGTLLRTALAFGFLDVIVSRGSARPYGSKALLASQGAVFGLNLAESAKDPTEDIADLRRQGYRIVATDLRSSQDLSAFAPPSGKLALVLGNEARGVEPSVLAMSDETVRIAMGGIDSLNVGVAGGILMHALKA